MGNDRFLVGQGYLSTMGMPGEIKSETVKFLVMVEDDEPVVNLQLITDGGEIVAEHDPNPGTVSVLWEPEVPATGSFYYVQVTEVDQLDDDGWHQIAVTAPIWVN